jgi:twitching motility two-component system response regulator PilH
LGKVLVVDDSEDVREFFTAILEAAGYDAEAVGSGREALARVRSERPDLVLLDMVMPGLDGFDTLLKLRSDLAPPVPPVILCSGFDVAEAEALRRGAVAFVPKPVTAGDLLAAVHDVLKPSACDGTAGRRRRASEARKLARETAQTLLTQLDNVSSAISFDQRGVELLTWVARYLDMPAAVLALLHNERLEVVSASDRSWLHAGDDLSSLFPPAEEVIETGSSLVLPDIHAHPCFSPLAQRLIDTRCMIAVPVRIHDLAIGVLCVLNRAACTIDAEDLAQVELLGRRAAALLRAWASGREGTEPALRWGAGMAPRVPFERLLDMELRLLDRRGGSLELQVLEPVEHHLVQPALASAPSISRMLAGVLTAQRVAIFKRSSEGEARRELEPVIEALRGASHIGAISLVSGGRAIGSAGELLRLAERELERAREADSPIRRLILQEEARPA